jgi:hypothetical protein
MHGCILILYMVPKKHLLILNAWLSVVNAALAYEVWCLLGVLCRYELKYTREIIGLGLANFAGAMSNAYTTTGSFSRTAVNNNAGV